MTHCTVGCSCWDDDGVSWSPIHKHAGLTCSALTAAVTACSPSHFTGSSKGASIDTQDLMTVRNCGVTMLENFRQQALQVSLPLPATCPPADCMLLPYAVSVVFAVLAHTLFSSLNGTYCRCFMGCSCCPRPPYASTGSRMLYHTCCLAFS